MWKIVPNAIAKMRRDLIALSFHPTLSHNEFKSNTYGGLSET